MTRHFNEDADAIVVQAYEHAIRVGHPYLGGEHLLLALAAAGQPAGAVLREHGVTPERTEAEIVSLSGSGLFGDLDRDALATVGSTSMPCAPPPRHPSAGSSRSRRQCRLPQASLVRPATRRLQRTGRRLPPPRPWRRAGSPARPP